MATDETSKSRSLKTDDTSVLTLIYKFHPIVGGAERQAKLLCRSLLESGVNTFIMTARLNKLPAKETIDGIEVIRTKVVSKDNKIAGFSYAFSLFIALFKHRKKIKIIHSHIMTLPAMVATLFGKIFRKPIIVKVSGGGNNGDIQQLKNSFMAKQKIVFLKTADKFISISSEITKELIELGIDEKKIASIPNGVDTGIFTPNENKSAARKKIGIEDRLTLCYVGRLVREKNVFLMLRAFKRLTQEHTVNLLIVGDGYCRDDMKRFITENKIGALVRMIGNVKDVESYIAASAIGLLPSLREGLSNSMLEMMACGVPVIASKVGGASDVIENNINGLLFDSNDEDALFKHMVALVTDEEKRMRLGENAHKTITEKYSIKKVTQAYIDLYESL